MAGRTRIRRLLDNGSILRVAKFAYTYVVQVQYAGSKEYHTISEYFGYEEAKTNMLKMVESINKKRIYKCDSCGNVTNDDQWECRVCGSEEIIEEEVN